MAREGDAAHREVGMGQHGEAVPVSVVPKSASGRVPTAGTRHLWEQGHLLNIPQRSSHHSGATAEAGHGTEPVLQPGQELRVLGHPMTVTMCPLRGGSQAQPPQWSTWEAHPRRSQLQSRAMFYVSLQYHSAQLISVSVLSITHQAKDLLMPIPKGTLVFSRDELRMPTLHQIFSTLSKMSHMASCQHQDASSSMLC